MFCALHVTFLLNRQKLCQEDNRPSARAQPTGTLIIKDKQTQSCTCPHTAYALTDSAPLQSSAAFVSKSQTSNALHHGSYKESSNVSQNESAAAVNE